MDSQDIPEAWEAYAESFSVPDYNFVPTNQLLQPSQFWQLGGEQSSQDNQINEDPDVSSGDEDDFEMGINKEYKGIANNAFEEIEEEKLSI